MTSSKCKHFPHYWPFVRGIHRSPVNPPHRGQWRGALMFSLICAGTNGWVNNRDARVFRRHRAHNDVTVIRHDQFRRPYGFSIKKTNFRQGWSSYKCCIGMDGTQFNRTGINLIRYAWWHVKTPSPQRDEFTFISAKVCFTKTSWAHNPNHVKESTFCPSMAKYWSQQLTMLHMSRQLNRCNIRPTLTCLDHQCYSYSKIPDHNTAIL